MHRLRRLLCGLRRGEVESRLPRSGRVEPCLDARERRQRQPRAGAAAGRFWRRRLPRVPHACELHRALPEAQLARRRDRGLEARGDESGPEGRAVSYRTQAALWIAQRASAAVLAVCVVVHLATIIYAVQGGLTSAEILQRTRGNVAWLAFYSIFVLAVTVHVPIGLRSVLTEWLRWRGSSRDLALLLFAMVLAWSGMRAVLGVFA